MTPLDGLRVLDVAGELGGYGLRLLADLGAEVVKVEPLTGDRGRARPPFAKSDESAGEVSAPPPASLPFAYYNAGKKSVTLDLADPAATVRLTALAAGADVVVVSPDPNGRGPVPGWDPSTRRPTWAPAAAIVCVLSDFGAAGPDDDRRTTHLTSFAHSGQMWTFGPPEGPPEAIPGRPFHDELSAHAAALIIAASRRPADTRPRLLELSVHDLLAWRDTVAFTLYGAAGVSPLRRGPAGSTSPPSGVWPTRDGLVEFLVYNPPHWDGFVRLFPEAIDLADPELRIRAVRTERAATLGPLVGELIARCETAELVERAQALRIPCAQLSTPLDVTRDPQLIDRGFFRTQGIPGHGPVPMPGRPFRAAPDIWADLADAPELGEHDDFGGWAGRADQRVAIAATGAGKPGELLRGVKVLTFGTAIAGNVSASLLAELGADVIKIEAPDRPDPLRTGPINPAVPRVYEPSGVETNYMFAGYSRSGRSIGLNMKRPEDQQLFLELLAETDVLIDNFATGVMSSWGLPADRLREANPRLVWVSVSGFGRTGPRAHYMAYGSNINSFLGFTRMWAPHGTQFDYSAVAHVLLAVQAGLTQRDRTGGGVSFDIAQIEAGISVLAPLYLDALANGHDGWAAPNEVPGSVLSGVFPAAGIDTWVAVEIENERDEAALDAILAGGPHFGQEAREAVPDREMSLRAWISARNADQAERDLQQAGLAAAVVRRIDDLYRDAQLWGRCGVQTLHHQDLGPMRVPSAFVRTEGAPPLVVRPSARLGEHTGEVIRDWLGRSADEADDPDHPGAPVGAPGTSQSG